MIAAVRPLLNSSNLHLASRSFTGQQQVNKSRPMFKKVLSLGRSNSAKPSPEDILVRKLDASDYKKGYLKLLGQLTVVGDYSEADFKKRFNEMASEPGTYVVVVIEDTSKSKIIATATLFVEKKFIRNCGKCGHIEDVVVDSTYRGLRLGARVVDALIDEAGKAGCYKVILDCSEENAPFYEKCGLTKKELQMVKYL